MSYRCGIGPWMEKLGFVPGPPRVTCDADGCGRTLAAITKRGGPTMWLLNRRAPPGWRSKFHDDGTREDYCPEHRTENHEEKKDG